MLFISVDLPEPETPVTQVSSPIGMLRSTPCKLFPVAPRTRSCLSGSGLPRVAGISIFSFPDRYLPVSESLELRMSSIVPCATISPPCTPAPGPMSMTWSALRMASSSCSTTITVLPRSRRWKRVFNRRVLSRWCRPIEGSSRIYITPTRPAPI